MNKAWGVIWGSLGGVVLGFIAGPAIAEATRSGCIVDYRSGSVVGSLIGLFVGRLVGKKFAGNRPTIKTWLAFTLFFAVYLWVFGRQGCSCLIREFEAISHR